MKRRSMTEATKRMADVAQLAGADRLDFMKVVEAAGLDPLTDFRFENWSGINFSGADLSEFDFTGARLHGCFFKGTSLFGGNKFDARRDGPMARLPRFDQAELGRVIHDPGRDPTLPGVVTPVANLREAADWEMCRHAWTRPSQWPDDAHLPIGAIFQDAPFAPEMVVVPPGTYLRGSPEGEGDDNEHPQRPVTIDYRFAVGRFPVTFEEWDFSVETGGAAHKPDDEGWGRGRRPVIDVSWNDIVEQYLPWLNERLGLPAGSGYRLLTEAEWEYCCRAGTETAYSNGDDPEQLGNVAWFERNSDKTQPVGEKDANAFGLHDMHGNVWEWCKDAYAKSYADAPDNGDARDGDDPSVSRVLRGGSWHVTAQYIRSADRFSNLPYPRTWSSGFRLARTLNP